MKKLLAILMVIGALGLVLGGCNKGDDSGAGAAPATTAGAPAGGTAGTAGAPAGGTAGTAGTAGTTTG